MSNLGVTAVESGRRGTGASSEVECSNPRDPTGPVADDAAPPSSHPEHCGKETRCEGSRAGKTAAGSTVARAPCAITPSDPVRTIAVPGRYC